MTGHQRRIISISLPFWASERLQRHQKRALGSRSNQNAASCEPVLTEQQAGGVRITAVPHALLRDGIQPGMSLADARAIRPGLHAQARDLAGEARDLDRLARWLMRYSPLVAIDPLLEQGGGAGLFIDSTGCEHLLGGEAALVRAITHRLAQAGITARLAIAPTAGSAWALARFGVPGSRVAPEALKSMLAPLPVASLRLDTACLVTLSRLGLKRVGDLLPLPRPSLARRFRDGHKGPAAQAGRAVSALLLRLDQVLGKSQEPLDPLALPPDWRTHESFSEPVFDRGLLRGSIARCLDGLLPLLAKQDRGIRRLDIQMYGIDGDFTLLPVGTSRANRDSAHLMRLVDEKLDGFESAFGIDQITVAVVASDEQRAEQLGSAPSKGDSSILIDRLMGRLGAGSVARMVHQPSHLPERQQRLRHPSSVNSTGSRTGSRTGNSWDSLPSQAPRPIRLLSRPEAVDVIAGMPEDPPERFRWRRVPYRALKAEGPERMGTEWWLEALGITQAGQEQDGDPLSDVTRDYYRVETEQGARFWLFRAGLYATPGVRLSETPSGAQAPKWYLHGMFA